MLLIMSSKSFFSKAGLFVTLLILVFGFNKESNADISTTVSLKEQGQKDYILQFRLVNESDRTVSLSLGLLPWTESVWNGLILIAVEVGPKQQLISRDYYSSNPVGHIDINPKQDVAGDISLTKAFPSLNEVLRRSDVVIFWSYQLPKQNEVVFKRSGGWVLIRKK